MQPFATGLTVTVATCVVPPVLAAVKDAIFPVPLAARPMLVLSFVQLNVVPGTVDAKVTALVETPLQIA